MCTAWVRFVIYGAGAIGGVLGGRLHEHGHDVVLIARGSQFEAIRDHGLRVESPEGSSLVKVPVISHPADLAFAPEDVVLLTMKSQDTEVALRDLAAAVDRNVPVGCVQNGVENERVALRLFSHVYGVSVMCPASHLTPGVVQAFSAPITGILDVGCFPGGTDAVAEAIARAFRGSAFHSEVRADISRWKYRKLLTNLGNAIEAVCGPDARRGPIGELVTREGERCLRAAGIDFASTAEDAARRDGLLNVRPIGDQPRPGGSSWQSLQRQSGSIETDYLNGEIVLIGRLHDVPTPANELLQRLANDMARRRTLPGVVPVEEFLARLSVR
jgi:2-dehydropantoate 2-reductase